MAAVHTLFSRVREGKKGYDGLAEQVVSVASGCDGLCDYLCFETCTDVNA